MGPVSAKSYPGQRLVRARPPAEAVPGTPAERAKQEADYGRRASTYVYGAFDATTGTAFTACYERRTTASFLDFLEHLVSWVPPEVTSVYLVLDNLSSHHALDVQLFALAHPTWHFVFQPTYAAYLNLIEPWWKTLRSLALKGRRFETVEEVITAITRATAYWNAHKHPYVWGRRRRHQPRQRSLAASLRRAA